VSAVLGKVTSAVDQPRGPDAKYQIRVKEEWLAEGATIEVRVPRNLECAACSGGGCDACGGSGALTLRRKDERPEILQVTLPEGAPESASRRRGLIIRIPESGGHPEEESGLPRGLLLLSVVAGPEAGKNARLSVPGGAFAEELASWAPPRRRRRQRSNTLTIVAVLVALWILLLILLRVSGHG
jgi:hypothetical protein